jgi:hypothetical protein
MGGGGIELQTTGTGLNASAIIDSTITGNTAVNNAGATGGGIDASANFTGDLVLLNDTINANIANGLVTTPMGGGGLFWAGTTGSTVNVENTIIAGNFSLVGPDVNNLAGTITDNGGNFIGLAGPGNGNSGLGADFGGKTTTQVGTITTLNALLGPLGNYGGPVIGTMGNTLVLETEALQTGSLAIGTGILSRAPANDERGFTSFVNGAINVGAVSAVIQGVPQTFNTRIVPRLIVTTTMNGVQTTIYNVNSTADTLTPQPGFLTLRLAIQDANNTPGNKIINLLVGGTYSLTNGELAILPSGGNVSIINASGQPVTVNGNHLSRVFDINPNFDPNNPTAPFTVTLQGFTITGGFATDPNNQDGANASGGGIRDIGNVSLTLTNMVLTGNSATADGGGVSTENTVSTPWKLIITNSTISNNHAGDAGGGIETDGLGVVSVTNCVITGNTCVNQGAGIWLDAVENGGVFESATLTVTGSLLTNNVALVAMNGMLFNDGGAIGNAGDDMNFDKNVQGLNILNSTIENNFSAGVGGGFGDQNNQDTLNVLNSLFLNNTSGNGGGGIYFSGTTGTIKNTELKGNTTGGSGGGLFVGGPITSSGTPTGTAATVINVTASTIANNVAAVGGGGIELETTATGSTITTSTITGNFALNSNGANGGGIDAPSNFTGSVTLLNDTINGNLATNGGGIFWDGNGVFSLQNTIVSKNFIPQGGAGPDLNNPAGTFTDNGGNLIGRAGPNNGNNGLGLAFGGKASTQVGTTALLDALLAMLGNNGGPNIGFMGFNLILETEALNPGSPAIGKGIVTGAPTTDERGLPFVINGKINVGAF